MTMVPMNDGRWYPIAEAVKRWGVDTAPMDQQDPVEVPRKDYLDLLDELKRAGAPVVKNPRFEQEGYDTAFCPLGFGKKKHEAQRDWVTRR